MAEGGRSAPIGCIVAVVVGVGAPVCLVGIATPLIRGSHQAAPVAEVHGFEQGPHHGHDGWYTGGFEGHQVAIAAAATDRIQTFRLVRTVRASQVAVSIDGWSSGLPVSTQLGSVVGPQLAPPMQSLLQDYVDTEGGSIDIAEGHVLGLDDPAVYLVHTLPMPFPDEEPATAWMHDVVQLVERVEGK